MSMQRADFEAITRAAGVEPTDSDIRFVGDGDPIYPSPLRLASGVASILGNIAGVVDDIRCQQTGQRQSAEINMGQAAVGISSMWVLKIDGQNALESMPDSMAPGQGIFPTSDGRYLYLLSGFPHIAERTLEVLGCSYDNIAEYVVAHDADEMEARLNAAQLPGVVVKSPEEWNAHPQGKLLADSPAVIIERIGDAPAKPVPGGELPLNGVRVIDNTKVLAGPTISRTLAALGADALHIGAPNVADIQAAQADTGHGKRRAHVDFDTAEGATPSGVCSRTPTSSASRIAPSRWLDEASAPKPWPSVAPGSSTSPRTPTDSSVPGRRSGASTATCRLRRAFIMFSRRT